MPPELTKEFVSSLRALDGVRFARSSRYGKDQNAVVFEVRGGPKMSLEDIGQIRLTTTQFRTMWIISIQDDGAPVLEHVINKEKTKHR